MSDQAPGSQEKQQLSALKSFANHGVVVRLVKHPVPLRTSNTNDALSDCACSLSNSSFSFSEASSGMLSFANREYELDQILTPSMGLVVVDAPSGYGKSELLCETEKRASHHNWACALIELNAKECKEEDRSQYILNAIADLLGVAPIQDITPKRLIVKLTEKKPAKNILLLFDTADANPLAVEWLKESLFPVLSRFFNPTTLLGKMVFAGRYMRRSGWHWENCRIIPLGFLDEDIVRQAVLEKLQKTNLQKTVQESLARDIYVLSCGHPGIINDILRNPPEGAWMACMEGGKIRSDISQYIFEKHVRPVVEGIFKEIEDESLTQAFRVLCIFRRYHRYTIETLQIVAKEQGNLDLVIDAPDLLEMIRPFESRDAFTYPARLEEMGLASMNAKSSYFHNGVIRELVLSQMQREEENRLRQLNALACAFYDSWLEDRRVDGSKVLYPLSDESQRDFMLESFCHLLNCLVEEHRDNESRVLMKIGWYLGKLRSNFADKISLRQSLHRAVETDKDIPRRLQQLFGKEDAQRIINMFSNG